MHRLTVRDLIGMLIIATAIVPFIGYSVRGSMPFVQDPRGMAGVGIAGCLLAIAAFGRKAFGTGSFETIMVALALLTLGFGIAALIVETSWALLVPMAAGLLAIGILALLHDAGYLAPRRLAQQT
jgi:hypothetical protein